MTRSGSGWSFVSRWAAMSASVKEPASSSRSLGGGLAHHGADGLGDLVSAAVAHRDIDGHPLHVGGARDGRTQVLGHLLGQQGQVADDRQLPATLVGQERHGLTDDAQQLTQLARVARKIIGGQQPQRHDGDARVLRPLKELADLARTRAVSLGGRGTQRLRPAAVPIQDDADMFGHGRVGQLGFQATLIHVVEHVPLAHVVPFSVSHLSARRTLMRLRVSRRWSQGNRNALAVREQATSTNLRRSNLRWRKKR